MKMKIYKSIEDLYQEKEFKNKISVPWLQFIPVEKKTL